jgi:L-aspartate oxidase
MVARCALLREESRGAHTRLDFPALDPGHDHHHAVVRGDQPPAFEPWT